MKATQKDFAGLAVRAAKQCRIFFFCGPDEAGASAAAAKIVTLLPDAGDRVDMVGAALRKDPALLGDEARSGSLFGANRYILVRAAGDEAVEAIENHLETSGDACPVLIVATSATDKSRTAKLLAKRDDALVAMFYPPDLEDFAVGVRRMADAAGLQLDGDLAHRIAQGVGLDVRLAQSEIDKLALYCDADPQSPRPVDAPTLEAIGARTEDDGFMPIVNAVLSGNLRVLPGELRRMRELSINPVGLLLAFERRVAQLSQLSARVGPHGNAEAVMRGERVFYKDIPDLKTQLDCWPAKRLDRLMDKLIGLHRALMTHNRASGVLLSQGLAEIARHAAQRR